MWGTNITNVRGCMQGVPRRKPVSRAASSIAGKGSPCHIACRALMGTSGRVFKASWGDVAHDETMMRFVACKE